MSNRMMHEPQDMLEKMVQQLAATPERLARAFKGKTPEQLEKRPAPNEWAATEILAHMRAVDDIVTSRIYMLLARDTPPLVAFDERRWAEIAGYARTDVQRSLTLFSLHRAEVIAVLQQLPPEAWQRSGQHEVCGTTSVFDIVQDMVGHEEEHCSQLEALFAPYGAC
jgi:hypothetical protein